MKNKSILIIAACILCLSLLTCSIAFGQDDKSNVMSEEEISAIVNTQTDASQVTSPFISVANQVKSSVVGINNYRTYSNSYGYGFGYYGGRNQAPREQLAGTGSGVVITNQGHILTNYHVIESASRLTVTIDGDDKEYEATVEGYDADKDIAVLHVEDLNVPPVELGDSDAVQVGEWAIVIGNPLGENFARTVTVGVVSALNREVTDSTYDRYGRRTSITNLMFQVDAAINSGNSGGGMFNVLGQLQGIPARKYSSSSSFFSNTADVDNIGLCIPINVAKPLIEEVLRGYTGQSGSEKANADSADKTMLGKPRLGVSVYTLSSSATEKLPLGALVAQVEAGSPAEEAGILVGDVIVEVNDSICSSGSALQEELQKYQEGDTVTVTVFRAEGTAEFLESGDLSVIGDGEYVDIEVTLRVVDNLAS